MILSSKHFDHLGTAASVAALVLTGCAGANTSAVHEGDLRKPDGIAIDPPMQPPPARDRANASDQLVTLRTPLGAEAARNVVTRFFSVVVNEDREGLRQLLSPTAIAYNPTSNARENALTYWSRRFDALDYQLLMGGALFRDDSIELYRADQWDRGALGEDTDPTDLIAHVRVPPAGTGRPLLGETLTFQLKRMENRYVIVKLTEDFSLP